MKLKCADNVTVKAKKHKTEKGKKWLVISQNNAWDLQVALLSKAQAKKLADFLVK